MPLVTGPTSQFFVSCDEIFGVRTGVPYTLDGKADYQRQFLVVTKLKELSPLDVCLCPGLPLPGSAYETGRSFDLLSLLIRYEAKEIGPAQSDYQNWFVTAFYSRDLPLRGGPQDSTVNSPTGSQNNPDIEYPDVSWDNELAQVALFEDLDGRPMMSSAGQPLIPTPTVEVGYPVLNITRNELGFDSGKAQDWMMSVNSDNFLGRPPGCVQCIRISSQQKWRGKYRFFRTTYRLKFARREKIWDSALNKFRTRFVTWQPRYLDQGTVQVDVPNPVEDAGVPAFQAGNDVWPEQRRLFIRERDGHKITQPVPLDGFGRRALKDAKGKIKPYYLQRRVYQEYPFYTLIGKGVA